MGRAWFTLLAIATTSVAIMLVAFSILIATDDDASKEPETWHVAVTTAVAGATLLMALWGVYRRSFPTLTVVAVCDLIVFLAIAAIIGGTG